MPSPSKVRRGSPVAITTLLLLAGCGGSGTDPSSAGNTGPVAAKAVADVDAAMADARRAPSAPARQ